MRASHGTCEQRPGMRSLQKHTRSQAWALYARSQQDPACAVQRACPLCRRPQITREQATSLAVILTRPSQAGKTTAPSTASCRRLGVAGNYAFLTARAQAALLPKRASLRPQPTAAGIQPR